MHLMLSGQPVVTGQRPLTPPLTNARELTFLSGRNGHLPSDAVIVSFECGVGIPADLPRIPTLQEFFAEENEK